MGDQSGRDSMGTMSFQIGDTVGDYKITGVVGSGGMGQVFKVEHTVTRRVEAMKVLAGYGEDDSEETHRSLREITEALAFLAKFSLSNEPHAKWALRPARPEAA